MLTRRELPIAGLVSEAEMRVPAWVDEWLEGATSRPIPIALSSAVAETRMADGFSLTSVRLREVQRMDILTLQQSVAQAYASILDSLCGDHPVRFWAFVPQIHADYANGLDRYMVFNAGRFATFSARFDRSQSFETTMATASTVGCQGDELALHCLASRWPGRPVENPRQVPAYRYSKRFGPLPPCFARGTVLVRQPFHPNLLLVGGTASIVGEESMHPADPLAQTDETLRNLASLARSACGDAPPLEAAPSALPPWLGLFCELRVYYRDPAHRSAIVERLETSFANVERIEVMSGELCRSELLVEIEGVARLPSTA